MTPTLLHAVARKAEAITPDADLLAQYIRERDHSAFEELVRRHGPLVWAVCRHLLPHHADAEDAFQAVFLALVRSAASIRDGRSVPAWLHGVAVRIATRAKREFARRRARERTAALPEADRPIPDVAWESLVAAVHEEVQRLPEAERTAFVLCDLQGVSQADAAARLGWPLGSVSGRLCKARQRLLDRLTARGVAPAAAVGIGLMAGAASALPAKLFDAVKVFPSSPGAASTVAAALARGLTEGVTMRMKLTAAAAVMVAAIGLTGGAVWLSKADAQPPGTGTSGLGQPPAGGGFTGGYPAGGPNAPTGLPQPGGFGVPPGAGGNSFPGGAGGAGGGTTGGGWAVSAPKWEYKFVAGGFPAKDFVQLFTDMGNDGWEFCGYWEIAANQLAEAVKAHPNKIVVRPGSLTTLIFKRQKAQGAVGGMGMGGKSGGPMGPGGGGGQNRFEVFQLKHAAAADVVVTLQKAFPKANLQAVAEKTSNSVIIISVDPASMKDIAKFIADLDAKEKPKPGDASSLTTFSLKFAKAADMVAVLAKVFPNAEMTADPRTNAVIVRTDEKTLDELKALVARLDVEVSKSK